MYTKHLYQGLLILREFMNESFPSISIFDQIGNSPLVPIRLEGGRRVWCKLEIFNPSGSVKDRLALGVLKSAWEQDLITRSTPIIEASSGSTAIALALICSHLGLSFTAVLPEGASHERRWTIQAYGGKVETLRQNQDMAEAENRAQCLADERKGFYVDQFNNKDGPKVHHDTAREIHKTLPEERFDAFVCGIGTGGTLVGMHQYLTAHKLRTEIAIARPVEPFHTLHDIGFTPKGFDSHFEHYQQSNSLLRNTFSEITISENSAINWTHRLWRLGFPVGPASGVNFSAAVVLANQLPKDANVVTIFTDRMERYFSTELFETIKLASSETNSSSCHCCICHESLKSR